MRQRVIKTYASDPLKADAVMYLQAMAINLWGMKRSLFHEAAIEDMPKPQMPHKLLKKEHSRNACRRSKGRRVRPVGNEIF